MNILTIATSFPYPPDDGTKIQTYERVRVLSRRHDVTLLCVSSEAIASERIAEMERYCKCSLVTTPQFRSPATGPGKAWQLLRSLWLREPYYIHDRISAEAQAWLETQVDLRNFDIVEADTYACAYLRYRFQAVKTAIVHSVADSCFRRESAIASGVLKRFVAWGYNTLTRWYESALLGSVDLCVALTEDNCRDLRQLYPAVRVRQCLSNGVDLDYFAYQAPLEDARGACFVGKMDYPPNVEAVLWFCRAVLPLVRKAVPDFRFCIVGSNPTELVKALAADPAIEVTGYVDDVRPYVRRCGVMVLPMRMGGGILNKLLQGLALGSPVIATSLSLEGLEVVPDRDLLVADSPQDLAAGIIRLVTDRALRVRLASNGRRYVEENHQWTAMVERYEKELEVCLAGRISSNQTSSL